MFVLRREEGAAGSCLAMKNAMELSVTTMNVDPTRTPRENDCGACALRTWSCTGQRRRVVRDVLPQLVSSRTCVGDAR